MDSFGKVSRGRLFDQNTVLIHVQAALIGGSWQGRDSNGKPAAWDQGLLRYFHERLAEIESPFFLDIGANTGTFSLLPALHPGARCYSFEPNPQAFALLQENVSLNVLDDQVRLFPLALSNQQGSVTLKIPASGNASGLACIGQPQRFGTWTSVEVETDTLDHFLTREPIERLDLIKIDTEGCELFVLQGAEATLRTYHPDILLEYYETNTRQFGYHPDEIVALLTGWGYEPVRLGEHDVYFTVHRDKALVPVPANAARLSPEPEAPLGGDGADDPDLAAFLRDFTHWVDILSHAEKRLYYRDQNAASVASLFTQARAFQPTVIVELGTMSGLSLRTWLRAVPEARVTAIDLSFEALHASQALFPLDLNRVALIQKNILEVDFSALWSADDRVLFFVDAHGQALMDHVLAHALPALPPGSLVIVDDLWFTPDAVTAETAASVFQAEVLPQIDELLLFDAYHAPYHAGGTVWGFVEVLPLLRHANRHRLSLTLAPGIKHGSFLTGPGGEGALGFDDAAFTQACGMVAYHPLRDLFPSGEAATSAYRALFSLYTRGELGSLSSVLLEMKRVAPRDGAAGHALAATLLRLRQPEMAAKVLRMDMDAGVASAAERRLADDLDRRFRRHLAPARRRRPGVTFFGMPKAFEGHIGVIQRNALESWSRLSPRPDIVLFGQDAGTAQACETFGFRHVPDVRVNDCGTPQVDDLFAKAQEVCETDVLVYINADIIVFGEMLQAIARASAAYENFLLVGARWDYDLDHALDFSDPLWAKRLLDDVRTKGQMHAPTGMDYFAFRPGLWPGIVPLSLGRLVWDTWLLHDPLARKVPVIDATDFVPIVHQNHDYAHLPGGIERLTSPQGIERNRNIAVTGGAVRQGDKPLAQFPCGVSVLHAPLAMDRTGRIVAR